MGAEGPGEGRIAEAGRLPTSAWLRLWVWVWRWGGGERKERGGTMRKMLDVQEDPNPCCQQRRTDLENARPTVPSLVWATPSPETQANEGESLKPSTLLLTARESEVGEGARKGARKAVGHPPGDLPDNVQLRHPPPEPPSRLATVGPFELRMTSMPKVYAVEPLFDGQTKQGLGRAFLSSWCVLRGVGRAWRLWPTRTAPRIARW